MFIAGEQLRLGVGDLLSGAGDRLLPGLMDPPIGDTESAVNG